MRVTMPTFSEWVKGVLWDAVYKALLRSRKTKMQFLLLFSHGDVSILKKSR